MVRKIVAIMFSCVLLLGALCTEANAKTYTIYENGSLGSTYVTYFRDILSGTDFNSNYVAFRSGERSYTMIVGDLEIGNSSIFSNGSVTEYEFSTTGTTYNNQYLYYVREIDSFDLNLNNQIIYSDLGDFPELIGKGEKYEILSSVLLCIALVSIVINRIFFARIRQR